MSSTGEYPQVSSLLLRRLELERSLTQVAVRFVAVRSEHLDAEIDEALGTLGRAARADRAYLFRVDGAHTSNTHEWCGPGIESQRDDLQGLPTSSFPWWMATLREDRAILVPRLEDLPPEATAERESLEAQDIRSLVVVPISRGERLVGFLGFDAVHHERAWSTAEVDLLRMAGITIGQVQARVQMEEEKRTLQAQLLQSQKLEAIGSLAGGVAHDFNNLLTGIRGYTDLLLDMTEAGDPRRGELLEIRSATDRAASLTQQLLVFARKQVTLPRRVDLNALVREARRMLARIMREDIHLRLELCPHTCPVFVDAHQIHQVLVNLCVNASDAMPEGGDLVLSTLRVPPEEGQGPDLVLLTVGDTGSGMGPETLRRAMEPFYTTKPPGEGSGLGLSLVYGAIREAGGRVSLQSTPGRGTTVSVYLPLSPGVADSTAESTQASPPGHETILLVEDAHIVRRLAARMLDNLGYRVLQAAGPEEALRLFGEQGDRVDLLLTDVIMPVMNGKQLYDMLSELRPELPVLYMSGYPADIIGPHGVLDEGIHFLQKPFGADELARTLRQTLDDLRPPSPAATP